MITYIGQSYPVRVTRRVNTVYSWRKHLELVLKLHVISAFDLHANAPVIFRGKKQKNKTNHGKSLPCTKIFQNLCL